MSGEARAAFETTSYEVLVRDRGFSSLRSVSCSAVSASKATVNGMVFEGAAV